MTPQEICALSEQSLDSIKTLKQDLDAAFEILIISGSRKDLQNVTALQAQIEHRLRTLPVAYSLEQLNNKTRVYIGQLEPGMFKNFPKSIEHVYTRFPERELQLESLGIGGQTGSELQGLMQKNQVKLPEFTKNKLDSPDFLTSKQLEEVDLIKLKVEDLGLGERPTTDQIYARIAELGLDLCLPEVGPYYRLAHLDQPTDDRVIVGMKPFADQDGSLYVFRVERDARGLWLNDDWAEPDDQWDPDDQFLFRLRKSDA